MIVFLGLTLELGFIGFKKLLDQFLSFYFVQILVWESQLALVIQTKREKSKVVSNFC